MNNKFILRGIALAELEYEEFRILLGMTFESELDNVVKSSGSGESHEH